MAIESKEEVSGEIGSFLDLCVAQEDLDRVPDMVTGLNLELLTQAWVDFNSSLARIRSATKNSAMQIQ